jgi:hypothetical protein
LPRAEVIAEFAAGAKRFAEAEENLEHLYVWWRVFAATALGDLVVILDRAPVAASEDQLDPDFDQFPHDFNLYCDLGHLRIE